MSWRICLVPVVICMLVLPVLADPFPVVTHTAPSGTIYALTAGPAGTCRPVTGGMECRGPMGRAEVGAAGCGAVKGAAFCLVVNEGWTWAGDAAVNATSTLECRERGVNYELSTGSATGSCTASDGRAMTCSDDGAGEASASCQTGCGRVTGAGSCRVNES